MIFFLDKSKGFELGLQIRQVTDFCTVPTLEGLESLSETFSFSLIKSFESGRFFKGRCRCEWPEGDN